MPEVLIPDAEALVGAWLRENDSLIALETRVAGRTPNTTTKPWIRVTQINAVPIARAKGEHHIDYTIQLDCYAGGDAMAAFTGQAEASLVRRTARAVLKGMQFTVVDDIVVGRVRFPTDLRNPDTVMEPARERYILIAEILMHPA